MKKKFNTCVMNHYVFEAFEQFCRETATDYYVDAESGMYMVLKLPSGTNYVICNNPFNINTAGSAKLCNNKAGCSAYLKSYGFNVPIERYFVKAKNTDSREEMNRAIRELRAETGVEFPFIIKPNNLSQGTGVMKIRTPEDIGEYAEMMSALKSGTFLVQEFIEARDYRITVLGGKVIQAYQRIPFRVVGDGVRTVSGLIQDETARFEQYGRDKRVRAEDKRIELNLRERGYAFSDIIPEGVIIPLQDVANLSLGGMSLDVTDQIAPYFEELAGAIAGCLNLVLCGADILAGDITDPKERYYRVIEVNSAPGMDHYAFEKGTQDAYVKNLYRKIFDYIQTKF